MAQVNSQWIRRCIIEASEEDREYGVATVLGPTWQERTGEIYCNLIDRTHCIGCVLTAAALEYSVSNWTETLDGALVLVEDAALVLNREKAQFNLRVAMFQVMRTSTGRDAENVISCFVMDDPDVKRAYEHAVLLLDAAEMKAAVNAVARAVEQEAKGHSWQVSGEAVYED